MKSSLLTYPAVLILGLSLQCSHTGEKAGSTGGNKSAIKMTGSESEDDAELKRRSEAMETELESASRRLAIENLKTMRATDEIRIWVGFGITHPRLFILQQSGERRADYRTLTTLHAGVAGDRVEESSLGPPKSGWDEFEKFLKGQGINAPLRLAQENSQYVRSPDVQVIVIEVKSGDYYGMVFFHLDNKSDSAQKALASCRRIEQDFDINMYCGPSSAT